MAPSRILAGALLGLAATPVIAAQVQSSFQVTSSVPSRCSVSAVAFSFGIYSGKQNDQVSTISVTCTTGTAYHIGLDNGMYYLAPHRRMKHRDSAHYLNYELYRDANRTARWGSDDSSDVHLTGNGTVQHINVYGRVPGGQTGPNGSYTNTTTVTVNF